jgi:hypothetical protein
MSNFIQKLAAISATFFVYSSVSLGFAASTSTNWQENVKQDKIENSETIAADTDTLQTTNNNIAKDPLELLSIGDNAITVSDQPTNSTLFDRDLSTWPYYLLSYDAGTDPEADFLISVSKVCGIIFVIGLMVLLLRSFKLRKLRAELSN